MRNFNIKRFWRTFRWYFIENRRRLLSWCLGLALAFMLIESIIMISMLRQTATFSVEGLSLQSVAVMSSFVFCAVVGVVAVFVAFSTIFSFLKTKQKRIAYLTLPATNVERYLAALLFAVVVWPICIFIAFALGDTLRMLVFGLLGEGWLSSLRLIYDTFTLSFKSGWDITWVGKAGFLLKFASWLWSCSLFILGGTWFRRGAFVIVTFAQIAFTAFCSWLLIKLFGTNGQIVIDMFDHIQHAHVLSYLVILAVTAVALFNFWLSYQIFKRFQIVPSKWTNI